MPDLKMRMRTIATYILGCCPVARTPASPAMPMAMPAAMPARPTVSPEPRSMKERIRE